MAKGFAAGIASEIAKRPTRYKVNDDGTISTLGAQTLFAKRQGINQYDAESKDFPYTNMLDAQNAQAKKQQADLKNLQKNYEKQLADVTSKENTYNSLADQIAGLTGGGTRYAGGTPNFNEQTGQYMTTPAVQSLSADNNFGATDLSTRLNFQVSDDQILNDYNMEGSVA